MPTLCALVLALAGAPLINAAGRAVFDSYQRLVPARQAAMPPIVVEIDDATLRRVGQWPWPRDKLARLVGNLEGAAVVGLDILLSEPDRLSPGALAASRPELPSDVRQALMAASNTDAALASAVAQVPTVLATTGRDGAGEPLATLATAARAVGVVAATRDDDGVLRRLPAMLMTGTAMQPGFAPELVALLHTSGGIAWRSAWFGRHWLSIGADSIATDPDGTIEPHFGPASSLVHIPAWQILAGPANPAVWQGRVVLVGVAAAGLDAGYQTPLGCAMSSVDVQAQFVESLLTGDTLTRPGWADMAELLLAVLLSLGSAWLFGRMRQTSFWVVQVIVAAALVAGSFAMFCTSGMLLNWTMPLAVLGLSDLGLLVLFAISQQRRRHRQELALQAAIAMADSAQREIVLREAAARTDQSLGMALSAARLGTWDFDLQTGTSQRSPRHDEIFGIDAALPWSLDALLAHVVPDERTALALRFEAAAQSGILHETCTIVRPDGRQAVIIIDGRISVGADGHAVRMSGVVADVTERRRLEARLQAAEKQRSIGLIAGGVAHQFNNVLAVIVGNVEIALDEPGASLRARAGLETALQAVTDGSRVTQHLLSFARRQYLRPQVLETVDTLRAFIGVLALSLDSDITLQTAFPDGLWPVLIDRTELELALLNLCLNARDAMPVGGLLEIAAVNRQIDDAGLGIHGAFVEIVVSDTGRGVDPVLLPNVFEPFQTSKPEGEGVGLGLSQVHGFAHQSGGTVVLESVAGQGTTVRLFLPAAVAVAGDAVPARVC